MNDDARSCRPDAGAAFREVFVISKEANMYRWEMLNASMEHRQIETGVFIFERGVYILSMLRIKIVY